MSTLASKLDGIDSAENNDADENDGPDFFANETSDYYLAFGDAKALAGGIVEAFDRYERPDVNTYRLRLNDIANLRQQAEAEGWEAQEALWAFHAAVKAHMGNRQAEENEGFGIGLVKDDDGIVTKLHPEGYAYHFSDLPTIEWAEVSADDLKALEQHGVSTDKLGFRTGAKEELRPVVPAFDGEPVPFFVENYDELDAALEVIGNIPLAPSLGNEPENEDANEAFETTDGVADPSAFNVSDGALEEKVREVAHIHGVEALQGMLDLEREGRDRKGAKALIEDAIEATSEPDTDEGSLSRYEQAERSGDDSGGDDSSSESVTSRVEKYHELVEGGMNAEEAAEKAGI